MVSPQEATPLGQRQARASLSDLANADDIEGLSVRQLKEILARNFVNYSGCCEKWELVERVNRLYRENEYNRKSREQPRSTYMHTHTHSQSHNHASTHTHTHVLALAH